MRIHQCNGKGVTFNDSVNLAIELEVMYMNEKMYVCIYIYVCVYMFIYIYTRVYTSTYMCVCT